MTDDQQNIVHAALAAQASALEVAEELRMFGAWSLIRGEAPECAANAIHLDRAHSSLRLAESQIDYCRQLIADQLKYQSSAESIAGASSE